MKKLASWRKLDDYVSVVVPFPLVCSVTPCSLYGWRLELGDCSELLA